MSLSAQHRAWGFPTDQELLWLLDQGIPDETLWPIAGATVAFNGSTFEPDPNGVRALIFRATDRGDVIDLVAWSPRSGKLASWRGQAFCLGDEDAIWNPATWFDSSAIKVHRSPLEWLRSNREGIVIVNSSRVYEKLRHCPRLAFADANHARQVRAWLTPPKVKTQFLVERRAEDRRAA